MGRYHKKKEKQEMKTDDFGNVTEQKTKGKVEKKY
jgi:hypothetical protein